MSSVCGNLLADHEFDLSAYQDSTWWWTEWIWPNWYSLAFIDINLSLLGVPVFASLIRRVLFLFHICYTFSMTMLKWDWCTVVHTEVSDYNIVTLLILSISVVLFVLPLLLGINHSHFTKFGKAIRPLFAEPVTYCLHYGEYNFSVCLCHRNTNYSSPYHKLPKLCHDFLEIITQW